MAAEIKATIETGNKQVLCLLPASIQLQRFHRGGNFITPRPNCTCLTGGLERGNQYTPLPRRSAEV